MKRLLCLVGLHDVSVVHIIKGKRWGVDVTCFTHCPRCDRRWVYSDQHQAYLRYDHDETLSSDLMTIHGLQRWELTVQI